MGVIFAFLTLGIASYGGTLMALKGIRASDEDLRNMATMIGTSNVRAARLLSWIGVILLSVATVAFAGLFLFVLIRLLTGGK